MITFPYTDAGRPTSFVSPTGSETMNVVVAPT